MVSLIREGSGFQGFAKGAGPLEPGAREGRKTRVDASNPGET